MASEVKPGQWINVKVTSRPRAAAAAKTMVRLFEQDEQIKAERKRASQARPPKFHIRGGRPWRDQPARLQFVKTTPGATYKIFASVDVLRDLGSIAKYVEITPA